MINNPLIVESYRDIVNSSDVDELSYAISYHPSPTESDYSAGFLTRYYVEKINAPVITEISAENYNQVSTQFYRKTTLQWKITGSSRKNKYKEKTIEVVGVEDYNRVQVDEASKYLPHLKNYVKNYVEFWRGS